MIRSKTKNVKISLSVIPIFTIILWKDFHLLASLKTRNSLKPLNKVSDISSDSIFVAVAASDLRLANGYTSSGTFDRSTSSMMLVMTTTASNRFTVS
jgi:hypothetical protein